MFQEILISFTEVGSEYSSIMLRNRDLPVKMHVGVKNPISAKS